MSLENIKIGFIGAGNMARAIGTGLIKKGLLSNTQIIVSSRSDGSLEPWKKMGVETTTDNGTVISKATVVIVAVKPYQLETALAEAQKCFPQRESTNKLFVSVLAGITIDTFMSKLHKYGFLEARVIRTMPNTPMMVGEGCSVLTPDSTATEADVKVVETVFSALGKCQVIPENLMCAACGLISSGPAFVYMVIEALADGGVKQGIPRDTSTVFAAQTVLGAAKMVLEAGKHPGQLKDEVCSPAGTTIHGVHALEKRGLRCALMDAVEAATLRGEEIAKATK